jgi:peptide/nickel transport system substrate-binding protein
MALVVLACTGPGAGTGPGRTSADDAARPVAPKRVVAVIEGDPHTVWQKLNPGNRVPGIEALDELLHAGLVQTDEQGLLRPQLGATVPTLENGLWVLLPGGGMETTYRINERAAWHDGTPFTSADVAFTTRVVLDREIGIFFDPGFSAVESVETPDPQTAVVRWSRPFIDADAIYRRTLLARHVLEPVLNEAKAGFADHPYWSREVISTGPFKLRDWTSGSHMTLVRNEAYVLGAPRIDEIEVRFTPDPNTLIANLLAGSVEFTLGRSLSLDQALQVKDQWRDGRMELKLYNPTATYPQLLNPNPAIIDDPRFRRALLHALDRQELAESLQSGLVPIAHGPILPDDPDIAALDPSVMRYEYDPRRAMDILESLGLQRGADGVLRDGAGQRITVEIRVPGGNALEESALLPLAAYWQAVGVATEPFVIPIQRQRELDYRAAFPGFELVRAGSGMRLLTGMRSNQAPTSENAFFGGNRSRYQNGDYDALIDRFQTTVPKPDRLRVGGQMVGHVTGEAVWMGLFFTVLPTMIGNRLVNLRGTYPTTQAWNAHEWDVR